MRWIGLPWRPLPYAREVEAGRFLSLVWVALAAGAAASGCSSNAIDPGADPADDRTAAVYEPIIGWLVDDEPGIGDDNEAEWVLYVASRSETVIDIDVQAAVYADMEEVVEVRFIDDRAEAVDGELEDEPVRDLGLLIGLGAVPPEGETVEVYADRYRQIGMVDAWRFVVRQVDGGWELDGEPVAVDARPLPPGS